MLLAIRGSGEPRLKSLPSSLPRQPQLGRGLPKQEGLDTRGGSRSLF